MDESKEQNEAEFVAELTAIQSNLAVFVRGLMPGEQAAEEVIQQTNAKIWLKREDFQAGSNFRAWSFAIARFEVLNYRKQQARESRLVFSPELEETIADELTVWNDLHHDRLQALRECMRSLNDSSRELLSGRYAERKNMQELAS